LDKEAAGIVPDHINRNGLDNRRSNLRIANKQQNCWNSRDRGGVSRFKGVHWKVAEGKWAAAISHDGIRKHLGYFVSEREAAEAYDDAAITFQGEFAFLNFPERKGR
jgi:hypothetical protein